MKSPLVFSAALVCLGWAATVSAQEYRVVELNSRDPYAMMCNDWQPAPSYNPTIINGSVQVSGNPVYPYPAYPNYGSWYSNYPTPAVQYRPMGPDYATPVVAYRPLVPVVPMVAYRPVMSMATPYASYSPMPVSAYGPAAYTMPAAAPTGPRVIVRPKVYVEGQPIRNLIKAFTP